MLEGWWDDNNTRASDPHGTGCRLDRSWLGRATSPAKFDRWSPTLGFYVAVSPTWVIVFENRIYQVERKQEHENEEGSQSNLASCRSSVKIHSHRRVLAVDLHRKHTALRWNNRHRVVGSNHDSHCSLWVSAKHWQRISGLRRDDDVKLPCQEKFNKDRLS